MVAKVLSHILFHLVLTILLVISVLQMRKLNRTQRIVIIHKGHRTSKLERQDWVSGFHSPAYCPVYVCSERACPLFCVFVILKTLS